MFVGNWHDASLLARLRVGHEVLHLQVNRLVGLFKQRRMVLLFEFLLGQQGGVFGDFGFQILFLPTHFFSDFFDEVFLADVLLNLDGLARCTLALVKPELLVAGALGLFDFSLGFGALAGLLLVAGFWLDSRKF